jgi:hypothetical protein
VPWEGRGKWPLQGTCNKNLMSRSCLLWVFNKQWNLWSNALNKRKVSISKAPACQGIKLYVLWVALLKTLFLSLCVAEQVPNADWWVSVQYRNWVVYRVRMPRGIANEWHLPTLHGNP